MDGEGQVMPSFDAMCNTSYEPKQWLQYYRNIWSRNLMGSMTDVQHDSAIVAVNPAALTDGQQDLVPDGKGGARQRTLAERANLRRENAERALGIIASIDQLMALSDADLKAAMTTGSAFLTPTIPAAAAPVLASFTVQPGKTLTNNEGTFAEGATVDLDPTDAATQGWVTDGTIAPTTVAV